MSLDNYMKFDCHDCDTFFMVDKIFYQTRRNKYIVLPCDCDRAIRLTSFRGLKDYIKIRYEDPDNLPSKVLELFNKVESYNTKD